MNGVIFEQTDDYTAGINAAHEVKPMDRTKAFKADDGVYAAGTLLKTVGGDRERWVQGTDAVGLITGIYVGPAPLDTARQAVGLVRLFGPVRKPALVAATAADGSTTADPTDAALDALEALNIWAL